MWARLELEGSIYHVVPVDDLKEHRDERCWCEPAMTVFENGNSLITHNAADGREFYEQERGH